MQIMPINGLEAGKLGSLKAEGLRRKLPAASASTFLPPGFPAFQLSSLKLGLGGWKAWKLEG
jgi:hypothetical protein